MKTLVLLMALASLTVRSYAQESTQEDQEVQTAITRMTVDKTWAMFTIIRDLKNRRDTRQMGEYSLFVQKTIGTTDFLVAKVRLSENRESLLYRLVCSMNLRLYWLLPEETWQAVVVANDARLFTPVDMNPNN